MLKPKKPTLAVYLNKKSDALEAGQKIALPFVVKKEMPTLEGPEEELLWCAREAKGNWHLLWAREENDDVAITPETMEMFILVCFEHRDDALTFRLTF